MSSARDQIIETTCKLLELQGYNATGLNQIIKESGSPKGSLYYYFPGGKEELAVAAICQAGAVVLARIHENLTAIDDPIEAIYQFIMNVALNIERSGFTAGGPITIIAIEMASVSDRLWVECARLYSAWQAEFTTKLQSGGFSEERATRLAILIISAMEGSVILCRTNQSRQPMEATATEIAALLKSARELELNRG